MKIENEVIGGRAALVIGEMSDSVYLYLHGKCGFKEEALDFAERAVSKGFQVVSIDLPRHGMRKNEPTELLPWIVVEELQNVLSAMEKRWLHISVRATSIGAWFAMLALCGRSIDRALFVSPIVDMEKLIVKMMQWSCISEHELQVKGEIPTDFGEVLSWKYLTWVREHPIEWNVPTKVLCGEGDRLTSRSVLDAFCAEHKADLFTIKGAEHYLSTKEQIAMLREWEKDNL